MVFVFHSERVDDLTLDGLREDLPRRVAVALSCDDPDGHLDSRDVEVRFVPHGPRDVTNYDVEIVIYANHFPSRAASLMQRCAVIDEYVKWITGDHFRYYVWPFLGQAVFMEGRGTRPVAMNAGSAKSWSRGRRK